MPEPQGTCCGEKKGKVNRLLIQSARKALRRGN